MFENQYVVLLNVRKPLFCYVFAFFQNMSHQDNFYEEQEVDFQGWRGTQGCKKCNYIAEQTQGMCPIPIQANRGRRWHLALPCLVDAAGDEGPRPSVRHQLSLAMDRFNFLFFWWFSLGSCLMTSSFHCWSLISSGWDVGRQCNC